MVAIKQKAAAAGRRLDGWAAATEHRSVCWQATLLAPWAKSVFRRVLMAHSQRKHGENGDRRSPTFLYPPLICRFSLEEEGGLPPALHLPPLPTPSCPTSPTLLSALPLAAYLNAPKRVWIGLRLRAARGS